MAAGTVHPAQWLRRFFSAEARRIGDHHLGEPNDGVERRAQLMAHAGKELRFVLACYFELSALLLHFPRALLDLLFQPGIGFLQPSGHVVELVGECLQFITGLDCDALGQIAAADARGAGPQRPNGANHAAREQHPGEDGETEGGQQNQP